MAKFDWRELSKRERLKILEEFAALLNQAGGEKAIATLLQNLLTPSEIIMIGRRVLIAEALLEGKSYSEINAKYKVALGTITSVHRWLRQGQERFVNEPRKKKFEERPIRRDGVIIGSPEHGMKIISSRLGLLGLLLR